MRRMLAALTLTLSLCAAAPACPNCKEAAASAIEDGEDPLREATAYNRTIYMMLAVPYLIVGFGAFKMYRFTRPATEQA